MDIKTALIAVESAADELDREGCQEPNENGSLLRQAGAAMAAEIERLREGYERLRDSTDSEMLDGDLAREIAEAMLTPNA